MFNKNKGFTLIELLVVIAIIAILASIALISLAPAQRAGRDSRRVGDLRQMQTILQLYYNKCGYYPAPRVTIGAACPSDPNVVTSIAYIPANTPGWAGIPNPGLYGVLRLSGYLPSADAMPDDPIGGGPLYVTNPPPHYQYARDTSATSYVLGATLETEASVLRNDTDGAIFGADCADPVYCIRF